MRGTLACFAVLALLQSARGAYISISDDPKNLSRLAAKGIHLQPTGPAGLPDVQETWETTGQVPMFLENTVTSTFYSGSVGFDQPLKRFTLEVARANNSDLQNYFTVTAYDGSQIVGEKSINLLPTGDFTAIQIKADNITSVSWHGQNWVFQPAYVRDLRVTFAGNPAVGGGHDPSVGGGKNPSTGTGQPVNVITPEPGMLGVCALVLGVGISRRRTSGL